MRLMTGSRSSLSKTLAPNWSEWILLANMTGTYRKNQRKIGPYNWRQWEDYHQMPCPFPKDLGNDDMDGQPWKRMHNRSWLKRGKKPSSLMTMKLWQHSDFTRFQATAISSYALPDAKHLKISKMKGPGVQVAHLRLTLLTNGLQGWTLPSGESSDHGSDRPTHPGLCQHSHDLKWGGEEGLV